uniref:Nucleoprotein TPR n=1 Tax=Nothobranchius furzeri TaxID=105023 RepID=A0A8C6PTA8_NOTFU
MAVVLLQALERTELNKLPKGIQNKLEKFITDLQNANEALKTQHERLKADSEQQYFDIEKRLTESQEQVLSATKDLKVLKEENKKLGELISFPFDMNQSKAKYELEAERRELARLLEKKTQEVENLTEDVKRLNEKLTDTSKIKMELQLKLDDIQSSAAAAQHKEKRMEQEKELLEKKLKWLTAELQTKTDELLNTNREKGKEILDLQGNLKSSSEQVARLESQLSSLREVNESQNKRAEDLNNKLKLAKEEQIAMEEKFRIELNAHIKLSSLYKGAATDTETKNQELNRAVEELSKLVKETGEANKSLEKKVSEAEELKTRLEADLREKIKKMEKELENATTKAAGKGVPSLSEEQLDSMCPSAAAIAAIVKPGMKFFDLYNAYAECQTQLHLEKQETRRVSRVLDEIVQEVESKAPVLRHQREEYESMQRSMASLCNKLEQARTEIYGLQKEKEEAKQSRDALERDKLRTERLLEDTSTQLCTLLVELEEARGNQVRKDDGSSADISSTSEVISSSQLSFRSVAELQSQNQTLLGRLRELEEEKDREQSRVTSARITELESLVDKLQKEAEHLREQRNQQKQLADSNARQRDMFKTLLTQSTGFSLPPQGQDSSHPTPDRPSAPATRSTPQRAAAAESAQTKAALKQLNDAFTLYKKEKAENDRMLNETNDRLQRQLTEMRSSHAKLTSQLEFSNKRYEILQETVSAYRREISALQDRNQKMAATAQQHEHIIHTMSQDLRQATEKLSLEEVRVENLTKERDMLKQAESRLSQEREAMLAEQRNQNLLLSNLKTIQLTMEHTETESRQRLDNKIKQLEAELTSMKTKLEQEVTQRHALGRIMDSQLLEAKKKLETQNTLLQKTKELLRGSEQQVATLKTQLTSASSSDAAVSSSNTTTPATRSAPSQSDQELSEIKGLLKSAEEQNTELAEQLKNANATVEQYRAVVLTLEDSLKKEKESRSPLEVRLKESEEVQKQLEKRILELEKKKQEEKEENRKAVEAVEKQVCELQRSLKASQADQQEALERAAAAVTKEQKATQDSLLQTKLAGEAQGKYERELMLHAADVEALQQLKKTSQQGAAHKRELEEELKKTTALLQEKTAAWTTTERQLKEEVSNLSRRCDELGKQNALLHQQMDEMALRSRQLQQQQQQQLQNLDLSFSEEGKTTEQIMEILRFVRREKEIAVAQYEASEGEAQRHKQRVEHQDRQLKELQEALNAERAKMQETTKMLAEQQEQLKKLETIGAMQETNRMLNVERDKLQQELQQAQAKVTKLQTDIGPLHKSMSKLSEINGSLQADKRLLEDDVKRWKAKVQQLVNQQKDGDVEEKQKLAAEKEANLKRIAQLAEETAKLKTELARSNASSNSAQSQLQGLRDSVTCLTSERDTLKKDIEAKNNDILEKNRTITQVKKIGRRYKTQYDELKVQHDKNKRSKVLFVCVFQLVSETAAKTGSEAAPSQESQQELNKVQEELKKTQEELNTLKEELSESRSREEQLRQQMAEKEEKTKKAIMGAKVKIGQVNSAKEKLSQEVEELKQSKEELEVRMNALKSQYEGRLVRLDRELRELKETHVHADQREEAQDQSGARASDQRQISLISPAQERGSFHSFFISSSISEPPTANIRPTQSTPSPSNKPSPSTGSKATPRASIRPMVTPATIPMPTPTATVMPTTQTESQEGKNDKMSVSRCVMLSEGNVFIFVALMSTGASVHSTSSTLGGAPASIAQPTSTQTTAFVQPTQQQTANQDVGSSMEAERPTTSCSLIGSGEEDFTLFLSNMSPHYSERPLGLSASLSRRTAVKSSTGVLECDPPRDSIQLPLMSSSAHSPSSSSLAPRLPHTRRPPHALPPRLYIQAPAPELGPPHTQVKPVHSQSYSQPEFHSGPFFDDDDRMVPSTPTLVVPHRTDGFAEAINSPQVAGLSTRFRFGPPEDLLQQASASHSDLGQLASQGGLGMYESPLFLAAHDEDGGGRSVPTTPLQVAAPVTVFTESVPSDSCDNMASQSVPMVTASTGVPASGDDGDEVFMEPEGDGADVESSLDGQAELESRGQQSDDAVLPSTSQDPGNELLLIGFRTWISIF